LNGVAGIGLSDLHLFPSSSYPVLPIFLPLQIVSSSKIDKNTISSGIFKALSDNEKCCCYTERYSRQEL
jgi:hypothetical protein